MPDQELPDISIVIPARNEEERLPATLRELAAWLDAGRLHAEVVVVVEPGSDRTPELAEQAAAANPAIRVRINPDARGKGFAVRTGMAMARGRRMHMFMDADFSVPADFIRRFAQILMQDDGPDGVIGSRHLPGSRIAVPQPLSRRLAGRVFNAAVRCAGLAPYCDTQCGFKAFRPDPARRLFPLLQTEGFAFDVELLWLARKLALRVVEEPVEWNNRPGSSVRLWLHGPKALRDLARIFRHRSPAAPTSAE